MKTIEDVENEFRKIDPELMKEYNIMAIPGGVHLKRNETTIATRIDQGPFDATYGGNQGLYEVFPRKEGKGFMALFGTADNVAGWLTLEQAVEVAEAVETGSRRQMLLVAEKYF